jgi:hypothetical protein
MRAKLAIAAIALGLAGCSYVSDLPGAERLSRLMGGGDKPPTLRPVAGGDQPVPAPLLGAYKGDGTLASVRGEAGWIVDPATNCATSNPFAQPDEEIRWFGACENGRLSGRGTLVWYVEGIETERNDGTFRNGEFHGEVVTTYPDGEVIVGTYIDGVRDGSFTVIGVDGKHLRANYSNGELLDESEMTVAQAETWREQRLGAYPGVLLAQAASEAPQVTASTPAANSQVVASVPVEPRAMAMVLARDETPPPPSPTLQLARADATDSVVRRDSPASAGPGSSAAAGDTVLPSSAPVDAYANRTSHVSQALGVQVAALATPTLAAQPAMPAAPVPPVETVAPSAVAILAPRTSFAATGTILIAGDGRAEPIELAQARAEPVRLVAADPREALRIRSDGAGALAQEYAGREGPWVISANSAAPVLSAPPMGRAPVAPVAVAAAAPSPVTSQPSASGNADSLFSTAYRLELDGRYADAERQYHDILVSYPSAPAALLANARLEALQRARGTVQIAQAAPATQRQNEYVVSANSPAPRYSGLPPTGTTGNPALALESPLINRTVCSQNGLYANDARWCGIVTFDEGEFMRVEVTDVRLNAFGQIGITRSTCTGNTFLTWFSRGASVRVPKRCMTVAG